MKFCSTCSISKKFESFSRDKRRKDGYYPQCKECKKLYYTANRDRLLEQKKTYHIVNSSKIREYCKENSEHRNIANKEWRSQNTEYLRSYRSNLLKTNLNRKIAHNLRSRVRSAMNSGSKTGSAVRELGCSIEYFKNHLESNFSAGMSWSNYGLGKGKWSLDHIVPLSLFDLSNLDEFKKACHYTNIRPMWAVDNSRKGNRL